MREEEEDRIGHGSVGLTDIWFFSDQPVGFFDVRRWFFMYHSIGLLEIRRGTRRPIRPYETFLCGRWFLSGLFDGRNGLFTYHGLWTITSSSRIISRDRD
jgi:hypothetical protein